MAHCNQGEAIIMEHALLGRMELGRCITQGYGQLGCFDNVLNQMDDLCTGKQTCNMPKLVGVDFPEATSCGELKLYLEATFKCASGRNFMFLSHFFI